MAADNGVQLWSFPNLMNEIVEKFPWHSTLLHRRHDENLAPI